MDAAHRFCRRTLFALGCTVAALTAHAEEFVWQPKATGWVDLLAEPAAWKRVSPSVAKFPLVAQSPWKFDSAAGRLHCNATGVYELLYLQKKWGDGILHVEWRYLPVEGAAEKNDSGVMFRVQPEARLALQVQLAGRGLGRIAGDQLREGQRVHVGIGERRPALARPIGEWNTLELTLLGRTARLVINGENTATITDLDTRDGLFGLQAEYWPIEFRHIFFKPTQP
ncbi:3-keto-disaccharide hydrolase [Oleiharenicola lentus]|uniref:3-keto-disaccharide hydrolase n=1 Tax=Oleiharenicola lentus TaxID=2508720 RepID=UPI003F6613C8